MVLSNLIAVIYVPIKRFRSLINVITFEIDKKDYLFHHEAMDAEIGYFIIDSKKLIDFEEFQSVVNTVITAYGFLNGNYMMDAIYYIAVKDFNGTKRTSFYYENFKASILSYQINKLSDYYFLTKRKLLNLCQALLKKM